MKSPNKSDTASRISITLKKRLPGSPGSVLVYLVVILLIFGVLGVTMVSLFGTSLTSSATPNYSRRAFYMAESGIRYALSELRNSIFASDTINHLNSRTYTVEKGGRFNLNVFGYWFKSPVEINTSTQVVLDTAAGEIPDNFPTIPSNLYIVNYDFIGLKPDKPGQTTQIVSIPSQTSNSITVNINDEFVANKGELICVAVHPYNAQNNLNPGDNLNVSIEAQEYFPERNGVIFINGNFYVYETGKPDGSGTYVELNNLSQLPTASGFPFSIAAGDFVILTANNYLILAEGESETANVKYGGDLGFSKNIYDLNYPVSGKRKADISFAEMNLETGLSQVETRPNLIQIDDDSKTLSIGGGGGQDDFGGTWYNEDKGIGGDVNQCTTEGCLFGEGIRVFFVLNFESQGDGIAFSLINGINNTANSIGGDIDLSELIAYAGDSRLVTNPDVPLDASQYLDSEGKGLQPPKIAVEFDTRTNNDPLDYCAGPLPNNINVNTRNDPGSGDKDAVQYVFWGRPDSLIIPCRDNSPLYDDNKHDPEDVPTDFWPPFPVTGRKVLSSPAIDPNEGPVYVGSTGLNFLDVGKVYAVNLENGTEKWQFTPEDPKGIGDIDVESSPALDANGNVYIGSDDSFLYALNKNDGNKIWSFDAGVSVESTPAVSESRETVYVEAESFFLYAVNNTQGPQQGLQRWALDINRCGPVSNDDEIESSPALGPDGTLYVGSKDGCLYAVNHDDRFADGPLNPTFPVAGREWMFSTPTGAKIRSTPVVDDNGTPADRSDDTIYVGSDDGNVYAVNSNGSPKGPNWPFSAPTGPVISSPALDANGNVYVGSEDGHLYAIYPDGNEKWRFPTGGPVQSSPVIDSDGVIYVGSNDRNVYAINPDGSEKWHFPTGGAVISSPANSGGIIFVGSNEGISGLLYAINQFIEPRNIKSKLLTSEDLGPNLDIGTDDDWLNGDTLNFKPWAVRLEVKRDELTVEGIGKNVYRLSLWLRQCTDLDCSNIIRTSYQDTRINYDVGFDGTSDLPNLPMTQQFELSDADHLKFKRFRWGFTSAVDASQTQNLTLSQFQLSFIRPADPSIATDIVWNEELGL